MHRGPCLVCVQAYLVGFNSCIFDDGGGIHARVTVLSSLWSSVSVASV